MKVKIGDTIYDTEKEPIMLILSKKDKENIRDMPESLQRYAGFPGRIGDNLTQEEVEDFMYVEDDVLYPEGE